MPRQAAALAGSLAHLAERRVHLGHRVGRRESGRDSEALGTVPRRTHLSTVELLRVGVDPLQLRPSGPGSVRRDVREPRAQATGEVRLPLARLLGLRSGRGERVDDVRPFDSVGVAERDQEQGLLVEVEVLLGARVEVGAGQLGERRNGRRASPLSIRRGQSLRACAPRGDGLPGTRVPHAESPRMIDEPPPNPALRSDALWHKVIDLLEEVGQEAGHREGLALGSVPLTCRVLHGCSHRSRERAGREDAGERFRFGRVATPGRLSPGESVSSRPTAPRAPGCGP